jgi:hypothetical protein
VAANLRNRISMQPMRSEGVSCSEGVSWSAGASLLFLWVRSRGFFFLLKLCLNFGVESGLSTVHFPLGRLTVWLSIFLGFGGGGWSNQRVPKFLTYSPKSCL